MVVDSSTDSSHASFHLANPRQLGSQEFKFFEELTFVKERRTRVLKQGREDVLVRVARMRLERRLQGVGHGLEILIKRLLVLLRLKSSQWSSGEEQERTSSSSSSASSTRSALMEEEFFSRSIASRFARVALTALRCSPTITSLLTNVSYQSVNISSLGAREERTLAARELVA